MVTINKTLELFIVVPKYAIKSSVIHYLKSDELKNCDGKKHRGLF